MLKTKNLLAAAFVAETICVTYALLFPALVPLASILYCFSGLLIAGFILFLPAARQSFSIKENAHHLSTLSFRILAVIIMGVELTHFCSKWISAVIFSWWFKYIRVKKIECWTERSARWCASHTIEEMLSNPTLCKCTPPSFE